VGPSASLDILIYEYVTFDINFALEIVSAYIFGGECLTNTTFISQPALLCMLTAYLPNANAVAPNIRV
jgi:hypothetical protein